MCVPETTVFSFNLERAAQSVMKGIDPDCFITRVAVGKC